MHLSLFGCTSRVVHLLPVFTTTMTQFTVTSRSRDSWRIPNPGELGGEMDLTDSHNATRRL